MTSPRERHAALTAAIAQHNVAYFQDDAPLIPDADYDALVRERRAIEEEYPDLHDLSSDVVGAPAAAVFSPTQAKGSAKRAVGSSTPAKACALVASTKS